MAGFDGARVGIGGTPGGLSGLWKKEELKKLLSKTESAGVHLGALYLHSFPNAILGNVLRDGDIEKVCKSIRLTGSMVIPVLLYNFYGLRNVEGLYRKPGRGGYLSRFQ
jgi:D-mannonate dehydratase